MTDNTPRIEYTQIAIDGRGYWYTGHQRIINEKVLDFFFKNLHRDEGGVFIWNQFGNFSEKGYITVAGPVARVEELTQEKIFFNTGDVLPYAEAEICLDLQNRLLAFLPRLQGWALIRKNLLPSIMASLVETENGFYLFGKELQVKEKFTWC